MSDLAYLNASLRVGSDSLIDTFTYESRGRAVACATVITRKGDVTISGSPEALLRLADHLVTVAVEAAEGAVEAAEKGETVAVH